MRPIHLLLVFLLLASASAAAAGIEFVHGKPWKDVLAEAKSKNKIIFLDAYTTWCGPCKYLQQNVFTDERVGAFFNDRFINVKIDMESGEGPALAQQLGVSLYPTLFFLNGDGEVLHKKLGATDVAGFLSLGNDAANPDRQFYTVRKKAVAGSLSPAAFHQWLHDAEALGETGLEPLVSASLARYSATPTDKDVLALLLDHATPDAKGLTALQRGKANYAKILGRTPAEYDAALQKQVARFALQQASAGGSVDYAVFEKTAAAYFPADAARLAARARMSAYANAGDAQKSYAELHRILTAPGMNLRAPELSAIMIDQYRAIAQSGQVRALIPVVKAWKLPAADAAQAFHRDFALLVLHYIDGDRKSIDPLATKIINDPKASEEVKTMTRRIRGDQ